MFDLDYVDYSILVNRADKDESARENLDVVLRAIDLIIKDRTGDWSDEEDEDFDPLSLDVYKAADGRVCAFATLAVGGPTMDMIYKDEQLTVRRFYGASVCIVRAYVDLDAGFNALY